MTSRRETTLFAAALAALVGGLLCESLVGGKVLSPGDVVYASASFAGLRDSDEEPANRLLMDPVLQFQPWLEFSRASLRRGRLPLWNPMAGCGAPHLANGQSAVFDPFHLIAYLGTLPAAHAWMAAARLWVAGMGAFFLARRWGFGRWGRWFAGLSYPICGFLIVWLLFPVASVAVWLPWLILATDRVLVAPSWRTLGGVAATTGVTLLAGHVQTSAHVLLAAGTYATWRALGLRSEFGKAPIRPLVIWSAGIALGVMLAAIEVIPLGFYLSRSPVWADRAADRLPATAIARPRLLDAACTALPYLYGSQRRGHPNLAKALGVHNLNESAGGFAGLATLLLLAPLGAASARRGTPARFLTVLVFIGAFGAFDLPPVANVLRLVPVLDVMDQRRLTLWVAFGLVMLGGIGLDRVESMATGQLWSRLPLAWLGGATLLIAVAATVGPVAGESIRARAIAHYDAAAKETPGADPAVFRVRAERQARQTLAFVPRYALIAAGQLVGLAAVVLGMRRGWLTLRVGRAALLGMTLADLSGFAYGLNPAIDLADDRPISPVIARLKEIAPPPARIVGVGAELPPNLAMRYGLADVRNYDSVELSRSLAFFEPLYDREPGAARTSRRMVSWAGVVRARDRLRAAGVVAAVGSSPPPPGQFEQVERVGSVWIARLETGHTLVDISEPGIVRATFSGPGWLGGPFVSGQTAVPGWHAQADNRPLPIGTQDAFVSVDLPAGARGVEFHYDPPEVRAAGIVSLCALGITLLALSGILPQNDGRKSESGAWNHSRRRVTIVPVTSSRCALLRRTPTEG